jgi:hypothetical protein
MRETADSAAGPAARCRKFRRGSFMAVLPKMLAQHLTRGVFDVPAKQMLD